MFFLKLVIGAMFASVFVLILRAIARARKRKESRWHILYHQELAKTAVSLAIFAVAITEVFVHLNGGVKNPSLLAFHLLFAIPFFMLLLVLRFWATGIRYPTMHRRLAYGCIGLCAISLVTGSILLINA